MNIFKRIWGWFNQPLKDVNTKIMTDSELILEATKIYDKIAIGSWDVTPTMQFRYFNLKAELEARRYVVFEGASRLGVSK